MKKSLISLGIIAVSFIFVFNVAQAVGIDELTVVNTGIGSGLVSGGGISCGTTCKAPNPAPGTTLTATPDQYSTFVGWSGPCVVSATNPNICTASGAVTVTATFGSKAFVNPANGHTYYFMSRPSLWTQAEAAAVTLGGHLITMNDGDEARYVYNVFLGTVHWIGLNDAAVEGAYVWSSGSNSDLKDWIDRPIGGTTRNYVFNDNTAGGWLDGLNTSVNPGLAEVEPTVSSPTLTVTKSGIGSGKVSGTPIDCGTVCSGKVAPGTTVTLVATPAAHSTLKNWTGPCLTSGTCKVNVTNGNLLEVTLGANNSITNVNAEFTTTKGSILVQRIDENSNPIANPLTFSSVTVDSQSTTNTDPITFAGLTAGDHNVAYTSFQIQPKFDTYVSTGSFPEGGSSNAATMSAFTKVNALPVRAYLIPTTVVAGTVSKVVIKSVPAAPVVTTSVLTVTKNGNGLVNGTKITNSVAERIIICGNYCSATVNNGTVITLKPLAFFGSKFTGWSGGGCAGTGDCVVTVNAAASVTANFSLKNVTTVKTWSVAPASVAAGTPFNYTLNWSSTGPMDKYWFAFVHFVKVDDSSISFADGFYPNPTTNSSSWNGADIRTSDSFTFPINTPPGTYKVMIGLYDAMPRVQDMLAGSGVIADDQYRFQVGTINVIAATPTLQKAVNTVVTSI